MKRIHDPEVRTLATYSLSLQNDYKDPLAGTWRGSPFDWIRRTSSARRKGAIGERLVAGYLACKGFDVTRSPDAEADRIIAGKRAEIKMSTLWDSGSYRFQQLRDQAYEFVVCLGISPFDAHCWALPKSEIMKHWRAGDIASQHGGSRGQDTAWIEVNPDDVPSWLAKHGGRLTDAVTSISKITGQKPLS